MRCKVQRRDWGELPAEITTEILSRVGAVKLILRAQMVCSSWYKICKDPFVWRSLELMRPWISGFSSKRMERFCNLAIDRSCGFLESVSIEEICTDDLLLKIAQSSPNLRRLRLVSCYGVTNWRFEEAAKRFPLLEEVELSRCYRVTAYNLGSLCPRLTSFKFNYFLCEVVCPCCYFPCPHMLDGCVIANTMPGLRHLQLLRFAKLTLEGLQAILDGCTHLQSLDLGDLPWTPRGSREDLEEEEATELEMRCFRQLKEFRSWNKIGASARSRNRRWERCTLTN